MRWNGDGVLNSDEDLSYPSNIAETIYFAQQKAKT